MADLVDRRVPPIARFLEVNTAVFKWLATLAYRKLTKRPLDGPRLLRAEERALYQGRRDDMMRALSEELLHVHTKTLDDLRAKVEALPVWVVERRTAPMTAKERVGAVLLKDVLALFGGNDGQE